MKTSIFGLFKKHRFDYVLLAGAILYAALTIRDIRAARDNDWDNVCDTTEEADEEEDYAIDDDANQEHADEPVPRSLKEITDYQCLGYGCAAPTGHPLCEKGELLCCYCSDTPKRSTAAWPFDRTRFDKWVRNQLAYDSEGNLCLKTADYPRSPNALWSPVATMRGLASMEEQFAIKQLNSRYPRCSVQQIQRMFPARDWNHIWVFGRTDEDVFEPRRHCKTDLRVWKLSDDLYFVLDADFEGSANIRCYEFWQPDPKPGLPHRLKNMLFFTDFPDAEFGNIALGALSGNACDCNNIAVILDHRLNGLGGEDDDGIIRWLMPAALGGCRTALYNLGIVYERQENYYYAYSFYRYAQEQGHPLAAKAINCLIAPNLQRLTQTPF